LITCIQTIKQEQPNKQNQFPEKGDQQECKSMMQSFIVEHYLESAVDVYCGGPDIFKGSVKACADNVLTLENDGKLTHIAIDKIIAMWPQ
jgi:hypothetical protein